MATMLSSGTVLRPTPFLGQGRGTNGNAVRDVVPIGSGKFTMVSIGVSEKFRFVLIFVSDTVSGFNYPNFRISDTNYRISDPDFCNSDRIRNEIL